MPTTQAKSSITQTKPEIYQPDSVVPVREEVVAKRFPRTKLIGEFALSTHDNTTIRWYKQSKPDRAQKHKTYLGLLIQDGNVMVIGRDLKDLKEERFRQGLHCLVCNVITYSRYRHDYHSCECGNCFVDGGPAYFRGGYNNKAQVKEVTIDLLKQAVVEVKK